MIMAFMAECFLYNQIFIFQGAQFLVIYSCQYSICIRRFAYGLNLNVKDLNRNPKTEPKKEKERKKNVFRFSAQF